MLTLKNNILLLIFGGLLVVMFTATATHAQPAQLDFRHEPVNLNSGITQNLTADTTLAWQQTITIPGAPWLRLKFGDTDLGKGSYLQITSLKDGSNQRLDARALAQWRNSSAYFNGESVRLQLHVAPDDTGVRAALEQVMVGEAPRMIRGKICGSSDDRTSSSNPAVGRLLNDQLGSGCTGWIVSNGLIVTAGHCVASSADVLQFNVPSSLSDGTLQHPHASDQYSLNYMDHRNQGNGNDWAVLTADDNPQTGLRPIEAQGASFALVPNGPFGMHVRTAGSKMMHFNYLP